MVGSSKLVELIVENMDLRKQIKKCDLTLYLAIYIYNYQSYIYIYIHIQLTFGKGISPVYPNMNPKWGLKLVGDRLLFHVAAT